MATMTFTTTTDAVNIVLTLNSGKKINGSITLKADGTPKVWNYPYQVERWALAQCNKLSNHYVPMNVGPAIHSAIFDHKPLTLVIDSTQSVDRRVLVAR